MKFYVLIARVIIGGLFVLASIHKIVDPAGFAMAIRNYMLVPAAWSNLLALVVPWIELGAGVLLILGIQTKPCALLTTGMLGIFLAALIYVYTIGLDINCGCFTSAASSAGRVGPYHLVRDTLLFLISLSILVADRDEPNVSHILIPAEKQPPATA
ncbi:MAG: DoxX family membrane protein [Desulfomonile sp.]|nr:DoxX family membrane protein [Desulfomonile sp.]